MVLPALGIRYPLAMLPVLLMQLLYKTVWLLAVYLPLRAAGRSTDLTQGFLIGIVLDIIAIPWPYVFAYCIRKPGDRGLGALFAGGSSLEQRAVIGGRSAVSVAPVSHRGDVDDPLPIVDCVDDAKVTHPDSPQVAASLELAAARRSRVRRELLDFDQDAMSEGTIDLLQLAARRAGEGDRVLSHPRSSASPSPRTASPAARARAPS